MIDRDLFQEKRNVWVALAGQVLSLLLHCIFITLFYLHRVTFLYYFNYFSVLLFTALIVITIKQRRYSLGSAIAVAIEVLLHQTAAVRLLGWGYGFEYLFIAISAFFILVYSKRIPIALTLSALSFICLGGSYWLAVVSDPVYTMPEPVKAAMYLINLGSAFFITSAVAFVFSYSVRWYEKILLRDSNTDILTNLANRKRALEFLGEEYSRVQRSGGAFILSIGDIDNFKQINDRYGHHAGDAVLVRTAEAMRHVLRRQDLVARWGGEEFLFIMPDTDLDGGILALEKLRKAIAARDIETDAGCLRVTMSFGLASSTQADGVDPLLKLADQALYQVKQSGKNRVAAAESAVA